MTFWKANYLLHADVVILKSQCSPAIPVLRCRLNEVASVCLRLSVAFLANYLQQFHAKRMRGPLCRLRTPPSRGKWNSACRRPSKDGRKQIFLLPRIPQYLRELFSCISPTSNLPSPSQPITAFPAA